MAAVGAAGVAASAAAAGSAPSAIDMATARRARRKRGVRCIGVDPPRDRRSITLADSTNVAPAARARTDSGGHEVALGLDAETAAHRAQVVVERPGIRELGTLVAGRR